MPIIYKKRVRTKFSQEQVEKYLKKKTIFYLKIKNSWMYLKQHLNNIVIQLLILLIILLNNLIYQHKK